jgi:Bacterial Ig domain/Secretion system C-terminal sorting domain
LGRHIGFLLFVFISIFLHFIFIFIKMTFKNFILLVLVFCGNKISAQMPCTGVAVSGDYGYEVYTASGKVHFKFHPLAPILGSSSAIIYVKEGTAAGVFPGFQMTASGSDFVFSKTIALGTITNFYFSYKIPGGGEANSSANPHQYIAGDSCVSGAPTVSIIAPEPNLRFIAPAAVVIYATASDADGMVQKVDFYHENTLIGTDFTSPFSFDWKNVAEGDYNLTSVATDNIGLSTQSPVVKIVVKNPNANGFCGTAFNGDYEFKAETLMDSSVKFTFHPLAPILGCSYVLLYVREGISGQYPGEYMTASTGGNFILTKKFADAASLNLYFTYQVPSGGERNSSLNPHHYLVGNSCAAVSILASDTETPAFLIYPNPANEYLFVHLISQKSTFFNIRISNVFGQSWIISPKLNLENGIDISQFPNGIYFLEITNDKMKRVFTRKFIKN